IINSKDAESVFEILMNSYKHLKTINVEFWVKIDVKIMDRILEKYGPQLTAIGKNRWKLDVIKRHSKTLSRLRQLYTYGLIRSDIPHTKTLALLFDKNNNLVIK